MVVNQQKSRDLLQKLSSQWQRSINQRASEFYNSTLNSLKQIELETTKIESNFRKLSSLRIDPEWKFDYSTMDKYFDRESIELYSQSLKKLCASLKRKVLEERAGSLEQFQARDLFQTIEHRLQTEGQKRPNKLEPMNKDKFQMLEELSQTVRRGEPANRE